MEPSLRNRSPLARFFPMIHQTGHPAAPSCRITNRLKIPYVPNVNKVSAHSEPVKGQH